MPSSLTVHQSFLDAFPDAVVRLDRQLRMTYLNPAAIARNNAPPDQFLGRTARDIGMPERDFIRWQALVEQVFESGESAKCHFAMNIQGRDCLFELRIVPERTASGIDSVLIFYQDITEYLEKTHLLEEAQHIGQIGSWEWDLTSNAMSWSSEFCRICGLDPAAFPTSFRDFLQLVHPDDRDRVRTTIEQVLVDHQPFAFDHRVVRPDGEVRSLSAKGRVEVAGGKVFRMVGTGQDITDSLQAQENARLYQELAEKQELLEAVVDKMPAGIIIADPATGRFTAINQEMAKIAGRPVALARDWSEWSQYRLYHMDGEPVHPEEFPLYRSMVHGEIIEGEELQIERGDGTRGVILANSSPVHDRHGRSIAGVMTVIDITQRKQEEEDQRFLAKASDLLATTLDWENTLQQISQLAVPHFADWMGIDLMEGGQLKRVAVAHVDPAKVSWAHEIHRRYPPNPDDTSGVPQVIRSGKPEFVPIIPQELLLHAARDAEHAAIIDQIGFHSAMVVPLTVRDHTFGAITLVTTTESNRTYTPNDLRLAMELAYRCAQAIDNARLYRQAQEAIGLQQNMLAIVSHDLKNPLNVVTMTLSHLKTKAESALLASIERAERAAERMRLLIRDLLDVAALEAGKLSVSPEKLSVSSLLQEAQELHLPLAEQKRQHLRFVCPDGLQVWGDRDRLQQVLSNLIGNAIKFTSDFGDILVEAIATDAGVEFRVRDTGPGIALEQQSLLFQPYWRGGHKTAGGTGLGLYITKGIIEAHQGTLSVDSTPGKGSTFRFSLPCPSV